MCTLLCPVMLLSCTAAAGEPVAYIATGSIIVLTRQQATAMAQAFQILSSKQTLQPMRLLWSLKEEAQQLLPAELHTSSKSSHDTSSHTRECNPPGGSGTARVLVLPWVNQAAVLAHPAVKLFVSHGGRFSSGGVVSHGTRYTITCSVGLCMLPSLYTVSQTGFHRYGF